MHDLADREAQQLVDALKDLGIDGARVRGRAYLPLGRRAYQGSAWSLHWRIMLTVRWEDQELTVEHLDDAPLFVEQTARSVSRVLGGAYSDAAYRCDRLRQHPVKLTLDSLF